MGGGDDAGADGLGADEPGAEYRRTGTAPSPGRRRVSSGTPAAWCASGALPARLRFRFGSNQAGVTFLCKVDRTRFKRCGARFSRRFGRGRHVVRVKARGATGLVDGTPAVFRFRVVRAR